MRKTSYRREFYYEDVHIITNAPGNCEDEPSDTAMRVNRISPSIRISNIPQKNGKIKADIADCVELNWMLRGDEITPEFRENYIKILRGELLTWKLFAVEIHPWGSPCLNFVNEDTGASEHLFIKRVPGLQMMFEVDRADDYTDKYLLRIKATDDGETSMVLTEYYSHGRCEIVFDGVPLYNHHSHDEEWEYIYVTEILY